ncbi:glycoside hydrolase family 17 protein, partial [Tortispora caseinolytica NRRL Y-17796]
IVPTGLTYSPYNDDSSCKTADQVYADLQIIASKGISQIRIYGTDCNVFNTVAPAAKKLGLTIMQGLYITAAGIDSIDDGLSGFMSYAAVNDPSYSQFDSLTIGNEAVTNGWVTAEQLIEKTKQIRAKLAAVGFNKPIFTAEPPSAYIEHPELCSTTSPFDRIGLNVHPYFDQYSSADQSYEFLASQDAAVNAACSGSAPHLIVETGYPHAGDVYGLQVPSVQNQRISVKQILEYTAGNVVLFTMYDDFWKAPGPHNVETYFGLIDLL